MSDIKKGFYWIEINNEKTIAEYDEGWYFIGGSECFPYLLEGIPILGEVADEANKQPDTKALCLKNVMPRVLHFVDENGNNVDLNAAGVNAKLLRDGTLEYFINYGFAGRKELTPVYGA